MKQPEPTALDLSNPAAVATWAAEQRAHLSALHALAMDATEPRGRRIRSRSNLRGSLSRGFKQATRALDAFGKPSGEPAREEPSP